MVVVFLWIARDRRMSKIHSQLRRYLAPFIITKTIVPKTPIITLPSGVTGMTTIQLAVFGFPMAGMKNTVNGAMITAGTITEVFSLLFEFGSYCLDMKMKYLSKDDIKVGALFKSRSYYGEDMIPAVIIEFVAMTSGPDYVRAIDTDGETFLANPDFLEPI